MPPKKKVERAATENISLGPQVREGKLDTCPSFLDAKKLVLQANLSLVSPVSSHPSMIPLSVSALLELVLIL